MTITLESLKDELPGSLRAAHKAKSETPMFFGTVLKGGKPSVLMIKRTKISPTDLGKAKDLLKGGSELHGLCYGEEDKIIFEVNRDPSTSWATGANEVAKNAGSTIHAIFRKGRDPATVKEPGPELDNGGVNGKSGTTPPTLEKRQETTTPKTAGEFKAEQLLERLNSSAIPENMRVKYEQAIRQGKGDVELLVRVERLINRDIETHGKKEESEKKPLPKETALRSETPTRNETPSRNEVVELARTLAVQLKNSALPKEEVERLNLKVLGALKPPDLVKMQQVGEEIETALKEVERIAQEELEKKRGEEVVERSKNTAQALKVKLQNDKSLQSKEEKQDFINRLLTAVKNSDHAGIQNLALEYERLEKAAEEKQQQETERKRLQEEETERKRKAEELEQKRLQEEETVAAKNTARTLGGKIQDENSPVAKTTRQEFQKRLLTAIRPFNPAAVKELAAEFERVEDTERKRLQEEERLSKEAARVLLGKLRDEKSPASKQQREGLIEQLRQALNPVDGARIKQLSDQFERLEEEARKKVEPPKTEGKTRRTDKEQTALRNLANSSPKVGRGVANLLDNLDEKIPLDWADLTVEGAGQKLALARKTMEEASQAREQAVLENNQAIKELETIRKEGGDSKQAQEKYETARRKVETAEKEKTTAIQQLENAEKNHKALVAKRLLFDAVQFGALSDKARRPLDETTALAFVEAFEEHPELASIGLDLAQDAKYPETIAKGLKILGPLAQNGFITKGGSYKTPESAKKLARGAMLLGGRVGGDYFERMAEYYKNDKHSKDRLASDNSKDWVKVQGNAYTKALGVNMIDSGGNVNFSTPEAQEILDELHFHTNNLLNPMPGLVENIEKVRQEFTGPKALQYKQVMDGVTAPTTPMGSGVIRKTLGLLPSVKPTANQAKSSILSAMLTPFNQGAVGSCFATGPCLKMRETQPLELMKDLAGIVKTGTLKKGNRPPLPVITNIAPNENPLLRGWEYTTATAGSRSVNSAEKTKLSTALFGNYAGQNPDHSFESLSSHFGSQWNVKKSKIKEELSKAFEFTYDPTADITDSEDGSSSKGAFVLRYKGEEGKEQPVTSQVNFISHVNDVVQKAINPTKDVALNNKIVGLLQKSEFVSNLKNAYSDGKKAPWDLPGGGQEIDTSRLLFGGTLEKKSLFQSTTGGDKTTTLVTNMVDTLLTKDEPMVTIGVDGIHAMNVLPTHPSLTKLKGTGTGSAKVNQHLLEPSRNIAETKMDTERTTYLFEKALGSLVQDENVRKRGLGNKPGANMTPGELRSHLRTHAPETVKDDQIDSFLVTELNYPEFVLIDTNWGSHLDKTFITVAPNPSTGAPELWKKSDKDGSRTRLDPKWIGKDWSYIG